MKAICKVRKSTIENTTVLINRRLGGVGKIQVKENDKVYPESVIAQVSISAGFRSFNLAKILAVSPKQAAKLLKKAVGDEVLEGEIIAEKPGIFGMLKKELTSPIIGIIKEYQHDTAKLTIQFKSKMEKIMSGIWGEVVKIDKDKVVIKSKVTQVFGLFGSGRSRQGALAMLAGPEDFLLPQNINLKLQNRIIVGGAFTSHDSLAKALTLRVSGIIAGGMHARDFWAAGGKKLGELSSDVGMTIVCTEGFGRLPISDNIYSVLKKNDGKYALIDGDLQTLIIPHQAEPDKNVVEYEHFGKRELQINETVRIIAGSRIGDAGNVVAISTGKSEVGIFGALAEIENKQGKFKVPIESLEIIE